MAGPHMLTPTYEENLMAFSAPPAISEPGGANTPAHRPMHFVVGLVVLLVLVAVLYNVAEKA